MDIIHISCFDKDGKINEIFNIRTLLGFYINEENNTFTFLTEKGTKVSHVKNIKKEKKELAKVLGIRNLNSDLFVIIEEDNEMLYLFSERIETVQKASVISERSLIKFDNTYEILYVNKTLEEIYSILWRTNKQ